MSMIPCPECSGGLIGWRQGQRFLCPTCNGDCKIADRRAAARTPAADAEVEAVCKELRYLAANWKLAGDVAGAIAVEQADTLLRRLAAERGETLCHLCGEPFHTTGCLRDGQGGYGHVKKPADDCAAVAAEREALADLLQEHRCNSDGAMTVRQCVAIDRCGCSCGLYLARARSAAPGEPAATPGDTR